MNTATKMVVCCLLLPGLGRAQQIDFFVDGAFSHTASPNTLSERFRNEGNGGNIIGGFRHVELSVETGTGTVTAETVGAVVGVGPVGPMPESGFRFSNSGTALGSVSVNYWGESLGSGGGINGGRTNFEDDWKAVTFEITDVQGAGKLSFLPTSASAGMGEEEVSLTAPGLVTFPFSEPGFLDVDFSIIHSVGFGIRATEENSSFTIGSIYLEPVPEPDTFSLLGCGCLVILRQRKSWRNTGERHCLG